MGQTLEHGVYLPDEGERNCYDGLAANWSILDGAVGTIAEHTTALAGKAPAVHTHTKSDVTDLFNSANVWTGNQTYSGVLALSSSSDVAEQFKQKLPKDVSTSNDAMARVNTLVDLAGHYVVIETLGHWANYVAKNTTLKYKNDSTKQGAIEFRLYSDGSGIFYAQPPFKCDLGNSYNKWKSFNGLNPGALSLPNGNAQDTSWIGDLTIKDGSGYNLKTFTLNGWITINIPNTAGNLVVVNNGCGQIVTNEANGITGNNCAVFIPVVANVQISILLVLQTGESVKTAIFAPCLGNV